MFLSGSSRPKRYIMVFISVFFLRPRPLCHYTPAVPTWARFTQDNSAPPVSSSHCQSSPPTSSTSYQQSALPRLKSKMTLTTPHIYIHISSVPRDHGKNPTVTHRLEHQAPVIVERANRNFPKERKKKKKTSKRLITI